ncbi:MAG: hypothetical protein KDB82_01615 [Planctomycetes bacterium]|nr:hypothetical protein [Planctomycetota bacterium]
MTTKHLLTVELAPAYDVVHICGDKEGLEALANALLEVAKKGGERLLATEAHDGHDLSQASQLQAARLVHRLSIHNVKKKK